MARAQGTDVQIRTRAAFRAGTPQKNIRLVTKSFAPSAGYMGKKTLKRNRATLREMALATTLHSNAIHWLTVYSTQNQDAPPPSGFSESVNAAQAEA
mmetsp:Transcript_24074/g.49427  ORF Transcript_24074/g.49427 Transcript_24074/m.49427 type:complete len:97 (+) Transcript_24074:699-989(+)